MASRTSTGAPKGRLGLNGQLLCRRLAELKSLRRSEVVVVLVTLVPVVMIAVARSRVDFSYKDPDVLLISLAIGSLTILGSLVPIPTWLWWSYGALTLVWSLAPGNTHITSLWEVTYLAAFAASRWRPAFWTVAAIVVVSGLVDQLLLNAYGLQQYFSGSIHYVAGAQALVLVPIAAVSAFRAKHFSSLVAWIILTTVALYSVLISGARAAYLPLLVIMVLMAGRFPWRSDRSYRRVAIILVSMVLGIAALEGIQPSRPLATALGRKASAEAQVTGTSEYGVFTQRLRFIDQTFSIALTHPFGAGNGSYPSVVHSFQKYPMLWSNSPHNYYVETVATGGWPRLALLVLMLFVSIWRTWRSRNWHWALGASGIWATFAFDVTAYYPSVMMFAFLALGASYFKEGQGNSGVAIPSQGTPLAWRSVVSTGSIIVAVGYALLWFWPCNSRECFLSRYHGAESLADTYLDGASSEEQKATIAELRGMYPSSIWVPRLEQRYSSDPDTDLRLAAEIATRFPLQTPFNYLDWAEAALVVGDFDQVAIAVKSGLKVFGPNDYPYGERRMTREAYDNWLERAAELQRLAGLRWPTTLQFDGPED